MTEYEHGTYSRGEEKDMSDSLGWILLAFALYLLLMVVIGAVCAKNNSSTETTVQYFLFSGTFDG